MSARQKMPKQPMLTNLKKNTCFINEINQGFGHLAAYSEKHTAGIRGRGAGSVG